MNVGFDSKKLRDTCESEKLLEDIYGHNNSYLLMKFFADLQAAVTLKDMWCIYKNDTAHISDGEFRVAITLACSVFFCGIASKSPMKLGTERDWDQATRVKILKIEASYA
ncbi:MAG: hypothetical protein M3O03_11885 [Pseudomonadota bacterium]|nr:hypothetical protein [Pseudomonadota bacterium]